MGQAKYQNDGDPRTSGPGFGLTVHPGALRQPYTWGGHRVVFVNSMSDLFHARVPLEFVRQVFAVIADTPQHTYQVLTKRSARLPKIAAKLDWPPNLWMGVSVEDAGTLVRVDHLRAVPAAVRFLSCEPLLGPLDGLDLAGIDWVIAGGESGPDHRPLDPAWVTAIRMRAWTRACRSSSSSGAAGPRRPGGRELDGRSLGSRCRAGRGSAQPDHAVPGQLAGRAHRSRPPCPAAPARRAWRPGPATVLSRTGATARAPPGTPGLLQPLLDEFEQLGMLRPAPQQRLLAGQRRAAGPRVGEADPVVGVDLPHGVLHDLDASSRVGAVDQVERQARLRDDLEMQLVPEPRPAQRITVGRPATPASARPSAAPGSRVPSTGGRRRPYPAGQAPGSPAG